MKVGLGTRRKKPLVLEQKMFHEMYIIIIVILIKTVPGGAVVIMPFLP